jgi:hypothetical protein
MRQRADYYGFMRRFSNSGGAAAIPKPRSEACDEILSAVRLKAFLDAKIGPTKKASNHYPFDLPR